MILDTNVFERVIEHLAGRAGGPMHSRLILQPVMAIIFAVRDGIKDGREGRPPYFWALFTRPGQRRELLRSGWKSVGKVVLMAVALDTVYQLFVLHWFYPLEAVIVACALALIPYLLLRGPVNRIVRARRQHSTKLRRVA